MLSLSLYVHTVNTYTRITVCMYTRIIVCMYTLILRAHTYTSVYVCITSTHRKHVVSVAT